ncbi:MAG TPA: hypothetical protein PLX23_07425 [Candidatus Hydrogenedens sp.]|nr:hypothetical protein [Candidatus Hydrogenedens sp.]
MTFYKCDGCGKNLKKEELRYRIKIEVLAVYNQNEIHLTDLLQNHREEIMQLIKKMEEMSVEELEEQIYKGFDFDLCPYCHRRYIKNPLKFMSSIDIEDISSYKVVEDFLASLDIPKQDSN